MIKKYLKNNKIIDINYHRSKPSRVEGIIHNSYYQLATYRNISYIAMLSLTEYIITVLSKNINITYLFFKKSLLLSILIKDLILKIQRIYEFDIKRRYYYFPTDILLKGINKNISLIEKTIYPIIIKKNSELKEKLDIGSEISNLEKISLDVQIYEIGSLFLEIMDHLLYLYESKIITEEKVFNKKKYLDVLSAVNEGVIEVFIDLKVQTSEDTKKFIERINNYILDMFENKK